MTGPSGSPAGVSVDLTAGNPNPGDPISFTFNLPDGTTESFKLTASNTTPLPTGSFAIGATPAATTANFNTALTQRSRRSPTPRWWRPRRSKPATISSTPTARRSPTAPSTTRSPTASADHRRDRSVGHVRHELARLGLRDRRHHHRQRHHVHLRRLGRDRQHQLNVTDSVQTLLSKIDQITGTSTPSTVNGGVITMHTDNAVGALDHDQSRGQRSPRSASPAATVTAAQPPLRVSGSPLATATSLVNGSANTVAWYTGNSGPGSARSTATVRIDSSQTVQFGAQANEQAIRQHAAAVAIYAAVTVSPTGTNSPAATSALSERIAANLTPQLGQQTISDIQTDFATAQTTMQDARARQTQTKTALQSLVDQTEGIDQNQVASQILSLQNSLQASYQTTVDAGAAQPDQVPVNSRVGRGETGR